MARRYYFAQVDDLGVLCVDQLSDEQDWTDDTVADVLAHQYPDMIYFAVDNTDPGFRVPRDD